MRARFVPCVVLFCGILTAGCHQPVRGEACKTDDDCKKANLECVNVRGDNSMCTTKCNIDVSDSCPAGWKCIDTSKFTDLHDYACVRQ